MLPCLLGAKDEPVRPAMLGPAIAHYQIWHSRVSQSSDSVRLLPPPRLRRSLARLLTPVMRQGAGMLGLLLSATPTDKSSDVLHILQQLWLPVANAVLHDEGYRLRARVLKANRCKSVIVTVYSTTVEEEPGPLLPDDELDPPPPYSPPPV